VQSVCIADSTSYIVSAEPRTFSCNRSIILTLNVVLDVLRDFGGQEVPGVPLEGDTVGADEELLEVPGYVRPFHRFPDEELWIGHQTLRVIMRGGKFLLEERKQRMLVCSVDLDLVKQVPLELEPISRPHMFQHVEDFLA